jgi:hypothetical protein
MLILFVGPTAALADSCDVALIVATNSVAISKHSDWRLSYTVTRDNYDQVKHDLGAEAIVYEIPIGINYDDYAEKRSHYSKLYAESLTTDEAYSLLHTGLDASSVDAYRACLDKEVFIADGLHAKVVLETETDIDIYVKLSAIGAPPKGQIRWSPPSIDHQRVESAIANPGTLAIRLPRPRVVTSLVGNYAGHGTEKGLILEPHALPPAPKPKIDPFNLLFVCVSLGHQGDVSTDRGYLSATNSMIGYTLQTPLTNLDTPIYVGKTPNKNQGVVTTHSRQFQQGDVDPTPVGYLFHDDPQMSGSQPLYVVTGYPPQTQDQNVISLCTFTDGKVTTSSTQGGCVTTLIGYTLP